MKWIIFSAFVLTIIACGQGNNAEKADMYKASELSAMMREMVIWSKEAKAKLVAGDTIQEVPAHFYKLVDKNATRGEHLEDAFKAMAPVYTNALKGIERKDSQQFYYNMSIQACKNCHGVYCGGPLSVINQL